MWQSGWTQHGAAEGTHWTLSLINAVVSLTSRERTRTSIARRPSRRPLSLYNNIGLSPVVHGRRTEYGARLAASARTRRKHGIRFYAPFSRYVSRTCLTDVPIDLTDCEPGKSPEAVLRHELPVFANHAEGGAATQELS